jgi:hypothetical protein
VSSRNKGRKNKQTYVNDRPSKMNSEMKKQNTYANVIDRLAS